MIKVVLFLLLIVREFHLKYPIISGLSGLSFICLTIKLEKGREYSEIDIYKGRAGVSLDHGN
jgi:hypothetical protein